MELLTFIKNNADWETVLKAEPFFIKTKWDGDFVLLKYDQIRSDFTLPLVRECRGIILDAAADFRPVCVPFFKFGNFGEAYVPEIDWASAVVQEKIDGSLIKLWNYRGEWHVSSNGEIDARNARLKSLYLKESEETDLYTLFTEAWAKTGVEFDALDTRYTYMFELTSPHNRVVVKFDDTTIRHIGTRDNETLLETDIDIGVPKPRTFPIGTLEDCITNASSLGYDAEGYVVVDRDYNRVKVKSPLYVSLSHLVSGVTTRVRIVEIIRAGEQAEFLTYFPEYGGVFEEIRAGIDAFSERTDSQLAQLRAMQFDSRKDLAAFVTKTECPAVLFACFDGKVSTPKDWLLERPADKILELI
jgi:hypothetical protein